MVMMGFHFRDLERHYPSVASNIHAQVDSWMEADRADGWSR